MPIHELMIMYGYSNNTPAETSTKKKKKKKKKKNLSHTSKDQKRKVKGYIKKYFQFN